MERKTAKNALELEAMASEALKNGAAVLTVNPALNARLGHLFRLEMLKEGIPAWGSPSICSFRFFVDRCYEELWSERRQLSYEGSLLLWMELLRKKGYQEIPGLAGELKRSYDLLESFKVEPEAAAEDQHHGNRNMLFDEYRRMARERGMATYAGALRDVADAFGNGLLKAPARLAIAGADELLPVEMDLLEALGDRCEVTELVLEPEAPAGGSVELFETLEDEAEVAVLRALEDRSSGAGRIALIFTEDKYLKKLEAIMGETGNADESSRPFLSPGSVRLTETALFGTMGIALSLGSGLPDDKLLSLVSSPFFRGRSAFDPADWSGIATSIRRDRKKGLALFMQKFAMEEELSPFLNPAEKKVVEWIAALEDFLSLFEDRGIEGPPGAGAKEALEECFRFMEAECGGMAMGLEEFGGILTVVCSNAKVGTGPNGCPGVFVMNLEDAAGLAFDKIYILGCRQGALPAPPPRYPLLRPSEKQRIGVLSAAAHYLRAEKLFRSVLSGAGKAVLSRPLADGDTPLLPTPFLRDGKRYGPFDIYESKEAAASGRKWLLSALEASPGERKERKRVGEKILPEELSVSAAAGLYACPFKFFMERVAGVEEPASASSLPSSLEWGGELHRVLEECATLIREKAGRVPVKELEKALAETAEASMKKCASGPSLREPLKLFLLGREGKEGLVAKLAAFEDRRASSGWRLEKAETWLAGVRTGRLPFSLKGKIDRMDFHEGDNELEVIDYKSGSTVSGSNRCQVALYKKMAEKNAGLPPLEDFDSPVISGGVIPLREEELKLTPVGGEKEADIFSRIDGVLSGIEDGRVDADPAEDTECGFCPFSGLCHIYEEESGRGGEDE